MKMMLRCLVWLFIIGCVSKGLCPCGAQSEPTASCGCEKLKRPAAAAVDGAEEQTASVLTDTAGKYSRGANERASQAQGDERELHSQVIYHCCQVKTENVPFFIFIVSRWKGYTRKEQP